MGNDLPMIPDRIEQLLSMFATVIALTLGTAMAILMGWSYEELDAFLVIVGMSVNLVQLCLRSLWNNSSVSMFELQLYTQGSKPLLWS